MMRKYPLLSMALLLLLSSCVSLKRINPFVLSVKKGKSFEIMTTENAYGWGVISHPFIGPTESEESVIVRYNLSGDLGGKKHALKETREMGPACSRDNGHSWVYGHTNMTKDEVLRSQYPHVVDLGANRFFRFHRPSLKTRKGSGLVVDSDGSITGPFSFMTNPGCKPNGEYRLMGRGLVTKEGWLIAGMTVRRGEWFAFTMISTNEGRTFNYFSTVADKSHVPNGVLNGPNESEMIRCENNDILCVMRTGMTKQWGANPVTDMGSMLIARSKDDGKTWDVRELGIPGVNPHMIRLQNGVLVLACGRPGNNLVFSLDDGYTWGHELRLTSADIKTSGYVGIVEVEPNKLLAVYDMYNMDSNGIWLWEPKEVNGVYGCFVEVKRRDRMSDVGCRMSKVGGQMSDVGCQMSDVGCQMSDVRCQNSDVGCRMSDLGPQMSDLGGQILDKGLYETNSVVSGKRNAGGAVDEKKGIALRP